MATIFGALGIGDRDTFQDTVGQKSVFDYINQYLAVQEAETNKVYSVFCQGDTTDHGERYFLPAGGQLQSSTSLTRPGAVKPVSSWDAGYPIDDGRDQLANTDVGMAYMTAAQLDSQVRSMSQRYVNWKRYLILRALLNSSNDSVTDEIYGSITVRRLANADGTLYPPVLGTSSDLASHSHYAGTNYATSSISDSNNPYITIRDQLEEHFGDCQIVVFINNAERTKTEALTNFNERVTLATIPTINNARLDPNGLPIVPGRIIGSINDCIVSEWRWVPSGYLLAVAVDQPAPLKRRIDEDRAASLRGFSLVTTDMDFPLNESYYRAREGYGAANRLNGTAYQLVASTSYTTPTSYS